MKFAAVSLLALLFSAALPAEAQDRHYRGRPRDRGTYRPDAHRRYDVPHRPSYRAHPHGWGHRSPARPYWNRHPHRPHGYAHPWGYTYRPYVPYRHRYYYSVPYYYYSVPRCR